MYENVCDLCGCLYYNCMPADTFIEGDICVSCFGKRLFEKFGALIDDEDIQAAADAGGYGLIDEMSGIDDIKKKT